VLYGGTELSDWWACSHTSIFWASAAAHVAVRGILKLRIFGI
jgi:hypothetical protein